jgi:plasmid stabilization system protein ParE
MAYNLIVKPEAEQDLFEALSWYEEQQTGLENKLYSEISDILEDITLYPHHFQERYRNIRIRFTRRFKYGIHYTVEGNTIYVHAILHTSRKPRK